MGLVVVPSKFKNKTELVGSDVNLQCEEVSSVESLDTVDFPQENPVDTGSFTSSQKRLANDDSIAISNGSNSDSEINTTTKKRKRSTTKIIKTKVENNLDEKTGSNLDDQKEYLNNHQSTDIHEIEFNKSSQSKNLSRSGKKSDSIKNFKGNDKGLKSGKSDEVAKTSIYDVVDNTDIELTRSTSVHNILDNLDISHTAADNESIDFNEKIDSDEDKRKIVFDCDNIKIDGALAENASVNLKNKEEIHSIYTIYSEKSEDFLADTNPILKGNIDTIENPIQDDNILFDNAYDVHKNQTTESLDINLTEIGHSDPLDVNLNQDNISNQKTDTEESEKSNESDIVENLLQNDNSVNEYDQRLDVVMSSSQNSEEDTLDSSDTAKIYAELIDEEISQLDARELSIRGDDEFDIYHREIIPKTFENILRMSKNKIKLIYSRIKNTIFEYQDIRASFDGEFERYKKGAKYLFHISILSDSIMLHCALDPNSLDINEYPHSYIEKSNAVGVYKNTRVILEVGEKAQLDKALELIKLTLDTNGILRKTVIVPIPYAEKYRINAGAVLKGSEHIPPIDGEYLTDDYDDIYGELTDLFIAKSLEDGSDPLDDYDPELDEDGNVVIKRDEDGNPIEEEPESGAVILNQRRQTAKNIRAAIALAEPIVYFFDVALDKNNEVCYVNIQQVLNDKFLGKMVPANYFAIAEGSERIEDLNFLALDEARLICNSNPRLNFVLQISCRLLMRATVLDKLLLASNTEHQNLIMAFDCALLDALGDVAIDGLKRLKGAGIKLLADNCEEAGMRALTAYNMDYMRFDARYYSSQDPKVINYLKLITGFCSSCGIITVSHYCDTQKDVYLMMNHGIMAIQGRAIGEPKRLLHVAMKERRKLAVVGG
jgi:EAL domain-containing protein (putative c-di-GMP-specific phosphodiesterase class I)